MEAIQYERHYNLIKKHWWYVATNRLFYQLVRQYLSLDGMILDAGCGVGGMLDLLKEDYSFVTGLDNSRNALIYCKCKGLKDVLEATVEAMPYDNDIFDGVISLDVLYHEGVKEDRVALREIVRVLRPGGFLFLQVPAYEWMRSAHDRMAHASRRYTEGKVRELLTLSNLRIMKVSYRVSILFPLAWIQRKLLRSRDSDMRETKSFLNTLFRVFMEFEKFLLKNINLPFGLSVIAVAQKR